MTLIHFEGGPWDGKTYLSKDVFGRPELPPEADLYQDGRRFKTSERTGATARVWVLKEQPPAPTSTVLPRDKAPSVPARTDLLQRREAIGASRALVAERSNLASSKLVAIETGTGKRIKDTEIQALEDTLTALEQEAAARAHG